MYWVEGEQVTAELEKGSDPFYRSWFSCLVKSAAQYLIVYWMFVLAVYDWKMSPTLLLPRVSACLIDIRNRSDLSWPFSSHMCANSCVADSGSSRRISRSLSPAGSFLCLFSGARSLISLAHLSSSRTRSSECVIWMSRAKISLTISLNKPILPWISCQRAVTPICLRSLSPCTSRFTSRRTLYRYAFLLRDMFGAVCLIFPHGNILTSGNPAQGRLVWPPSASMKMSSSELSWSGWFSEFKFNLVS